MKVNTGLCSTTALMNIINLFNDLYGNTARGTLKRILV